MTLGKRIARQRKKNGLSQEQLGDQLNVSRQAISRWEADKAAPDIDNITHLCELFDVSADYFLFGKSSHKPPSPPPTAITPEDTAARSRKSTFFKVLGMLILTFFPFFLKLLQLMDSFNNSWHTSYWDYISSAPAVFVLIAAGCFLFYGLFGEKIRKYYENY